MSPFRIRSIQVKIALWAWLCLFASSAVLIGYSISTLRASAIQSATDQSISVAETQAGIYKAQIEVALHAARTMADSLSAVKDPLQPVTLTRDQVNGMLRKLLQENPQFLGTYTLWEPDAFDGQDAAYANTPLHDPSGRFIPYWVRGDDGTIHAEPLIEYETPGIGDWYLTPRNTHREVIIAPFFYPIQGKDVLLTSLVVPIVENDQFYGIAGVDLRIDFVQSVIDQVDLYGGQARAALITGAGALAAVSRQPDLVNQPATSFSANYPQLAAQLASQASFFAPSPDGQDLQVFAPVLFGETGTTWWVAIIVPYRTILAETTGLVIRQIAISAVSILIAMLLIWLLAGQISRPVRTVTRAAQSVAAGDLSAVADVKTSDETGLLAAAFNQMTAQLRSLVGTLEQRVADRTRALETSNEVSRRLSTILDQAQLFSAVVDEIQRAFDYYHVHIYIFDENRQYLRMMGGTGAAGQAMLNQGHKISRGHGLVGRAAAANQVVLVSDTRSDPGWLPNPLLPETRSEVAVPIAIGDQVTGVLDVQQNVIAGLDQQDADLLLSIASQVAIAVQNTRLYTLAQREAEREALTSAIGRKIQSTHSVDAALQTALREIGIALGAPLAGIHIGLHHTGAPTPGVGARAGGENDS